MKEIKKVWKYFAYRECDAMADYFEKMALEGWHLESIGFVTKFKKGIPKKVRYEIEVFPKASEFDLKPEPDTEEFTEYCLKAGWEFVCTQRRFCVFRTDDPDVVPIETDELQRFEHIKKGENRSANYDFVTILALSIMSFSSFLRSPENYFKNDMVCFAIIMFSLLLNSLIKFLEVKYWQFSTGRKLKQQLSVRYGRRTALLRTADLLLPAAALLALCIINIVAKNYVNLLIMIVELFFILIIITIVMIRKPSRADNLTIQGIGGILLGFLMIGIAWSGLSDPSMKRPTMTIEKLPLQMSDLRNDDSTTKEIVIYESNQGFLGAREFYALEVSTGDFLTYEVIESTQNWLLEKFWKEELKSEYTKYAVSEKDAKNWDAVSFAHSPGRGTPQYAIRYPERLIIFGYEGEITPQIMDTIKEKLKIHE